MPENPDVATYDPGTRRARAPDPPDDQLISLAAAVAAGPARLLDPDNRAGPTTSIRDAVGARAAYFVPVADDVLAVDLDTSSDPTRDTTARAAFDRLGVALEAAGHGYVTVTSGRPGHRHLFARVEDPVTRAELDAWCRAQHLDARRHQRPPLAPHRSGLPIALEHVHDPRNPGGAGPADATTVLRRHPAPGATGRTLELLDAPRLSGRMRRVIAEGHTAGGYPTPSHARLAVTVAGLAAGFDPAWVTSLFDDPTHAVGASRSRTGRAATPVAARAT